jgi:hypothetical protein
MICTRCNTYNVDGVAVCVNCSTSFRASSARARTPLRARRWYGAGKVVLGVLVGLTVIGYAQQWADTISLDAQYAKTINGDPHDPLGAADPAHASELHALTQVLHGCIFLAVCIGAIGVWGICTRLFPVRYSRSGRFLTGGAKVWPIGWVDGSAAAVSKYVETITRGGGTWPDGAPNPVTTRTVVHDNFVLTDRFG